MAELLITGNTGLLPQKILEDLSKEHKLVVTVSSEQEECAGKEGNIHVYCTTPMEKKFSQLFDAYDFRAVWYLSGYADGKTGCFGEAQWLEQILSCCGSHVVEKLVVLSTTESRSFFEQVGRSGELLGREYESGTAFGAAQMEDLCRYFAGKTKTKVITLWCPYLAGPVNEDQFLGQLFGKMLEQEKIILPYAKEERLDFLSMRDLGVLIEEILQETEDDTASYYAVSGFRHTWGELGDLVLELAPQVMLEYENRHSLAELPDYPAKLRKVYGFVPRDDVMGDVKQYYHDYVEKLRGRDRSFFRKAGQRLWQAGKGSFKYIELFLVFFLAEYVSGYTSESVYFKILDIRLLFIVMMGTIYGMRVGVAAAILECVVLAKRYQEMGLGAVVLFYNMENWIPFVCYLMIGSVVGHLSDRKASEVEFSKKELVLLRDKYSFLSRVYRGVLNNRSEYRRQILGFEDSFGKIFEAVQKLDSELVGSIFIRGLQVLEEILQNHTIAIYTLDAWQKYGRLMVCSNSLLAKLTKSLRVSDVQELYDTVLRGEVYHNAGFKAGYPVYGCSILRDGRVAFLVMIWEAEAEQQGIYYKNLFRILCGLVQTSFLRAMDYEELKRTAEYYEGTSIARPEYFASNLQIQEDMKEAGISDYVLVKLRSKDLKEISEKIASMIRATDLLGTDEDGNIYLVLTQTRTEQFGVVGKRLEERGIGYEIVEGTG